ncbi:MAG: DUF6527 family protein [Immundisolibacteraceae bacterium]|nr:DUF6527 family protein [Immundisolibacteraceae bacterium]
MQIELEHVHYMPKELKPGVLYVSKEFKTAAHLCACGCGAKIRTPLGPTEWSVEEANKKPTLHPSVGNWQQACQSHYWIIRGEIRWSRKWSREEIAMGRQIEEQRRRDHFDELGYQNSKVIKKFWRWGKSFFT